MALTWWRRKGLGRKDWRFSERALTKAEGDFSVGNFCFLRQRPWGEKSARRVLVPPISILKNI